MLLEKMCCRRNIVAILTIGIVVGSGIYCYIFLTAPIESYYSYPTYKFFLSSNQIINCSSFLFNATERNSSNSKISDDTTDIDVLNLVGKGCAYLTRKYIFNLNYQFVTAKEKDFPIAYSMLAHQNAHQLLLLLSAIYAPQNIYCIHIDLKSSSAMFEAVKQAISCFPNIFLATKRVDVVYIGVSRLQADLNCMEDLLNVPINLNKWEYLINLCGQDFPIMTNLEIVQQLKALNGRNVIGGDGKPSASTLKRTKFVHVIGNYTTVDGKMERRMIKTKELKSPPPFNITIRKNLAYNIYTRRFLHWVIFESEKAKALLEWSRDTATPDEHYWLMLDALEEAPGRSDKISWWTPARYIVWRSARGSTCAGYYNHYSCVFGTGDLPKIIRQRKLFANKFDITYDSLPVTCLRKWLDDKTFENFDAHQQEGKVSGIIY